MSAHVYHEIYLHLNWHVKNDCPSLTKQVEPVAHRMIIERCRLAKGVYLHGINGTADHVYLAVNIEPFVTISELVKERKGGSSYDVNREPGRKALYWQRGYGIVSFGKRDLPWVLKSPLGAQRGWASLRPSLRAKSARRVSLFNGFTFPFARRKTPG